MSLRIRSIEPTPLFARREPGGTRQLVRLELENDGEPADASLSIDGGGVDERTALGRVPRGTSRHEVSLPDVRRPIRVRFALWSGGVLHHEQQVAWRPERHWEVHLVHGSHLDIGYTDLPTNVIREHVSYIDQIVSYCQETADWPEESRFRYVAEQAWSVLAWLERKPHAAREPLLALLREGRVEVTALHDNSTSELPGHECQVRLAYPAFRLKRLYGVPVSTAELNDIPGVSWGLAKVLAGSGIRYFAPGIQDYFSWGMRVRPFWDEERVLARDMLGAFWWEAQDGSRVLFWYGGQKIESLELWTFEQTEADLPAWLTRLSARGYAHDLVRVKVLAGRRDNSPPDLRFSQIARQWNDTWAYPRLVLSTNARFFSRFEERSGKLLPVLRGDLTATDYPIGATSRARELGTNRLTHDLLSSAEKLSACAAALGGYDYPAEALSEALECTLLYDEHTGGMAHPIGPAQEASWSWKAERAHRAAALSHDALAKAANWIADHVRISEDGYHVVVFNPLGHARTDVVRVQAQPPSPGGMRMSWLEPEAGRTTRVLGATHLIGRMPVSLPVELLEQPFELIDLATGEKVPCQIVTLSDPLAARPLADQRWALGNVDSRSLESLNWGPAHLREIVFVAREVPAVGFRTYRITPVPTRSRPTQAAPASLSGLRVEAQAIENRFYRVELDPTNGVVASIVDKELGRQLVDRQAPHGFGQLVVRSPRTGETATGGSSTIRVGERGPVLASLIAKGEGPGCPVRVQEITLYADLKRIDFAIRLLKDATPLHETYVAFPFDLRSPQFRLESANGVLEPIRDQLPGACTAAYTAQHWVAAWDGEKCVAWTALEAPVVELSGLWPSPVSQAHHGATPKGFGEEFLKDPSELSKAHLYSFVMSNNYRTNFQVSQAADVLFRYAVTSGKGDWRQLRAAAFGWEASTPLEPVCVKGRQVGRLEPAASFCSLDRPNVLLLALKAAEDGDGLVLRLAEFEGMDTEVTVTLPTLDIKEVRAVNLVEEDRFPVPGDGHAVRVEVPANGFATIRVKTGRHLPTCDRLTWM